MINTLSKTFTLLFKDEDFYLKGVMPISLLFKAEE